MKVVRIYPKTNFHTYLNSDTLWGNIVYSYRMLNGVDKTTELLKKYLANEIPFKVSSIFPFEVKNNGKCEIIYYFPKPITGVSISNDKAPEYMTFSVSIRNAKDPEEMTYMKEFKKIRYIDKTLFEAYIKGNINDNELLERFLVWQKEENKVESERNKDLIEKNKFNYKKNLTPSFFLHNSIDRMSGSTLQKDGRGQLYWEEEFNVIGNKLPSKENVVEGIYFLVDGKEVSLIEGPLRLLSHIGIGGNKSIGKGSFDFVIEDFGFSSTTEHNSNKYNSFVSLSLFQPRKEEIEILKSSSMYYDLTIRIGKVGKDFNLEFNEKNPIICFTEGSSFCVNDPLIGSLIPTAKYTNNQDVFSNYLFFGVKANLRLQ